jgi:hypothetical protein
MSAYGKPASDFELPDWALSGRSLPRCWLQQCDECSCCACVSASRTSRRSLGERLDHPERTMDSTKTSRARKLRVKALRFTAGPFLSFSIEGGGAEPPYEILSNIAYSPGVDACISVRTQMEGPVGPPGLPENTYLLNMARRLLPYSSRTD